VQHAVPRGQVKEVSLMLKQEFRTLQEELAINPNKYNVLFLDFL